ncbi:MAG: GLUG motif-containing protein [Planctomycetota bacterium]
MKPLLGLFIICLLSLPAGAKYGGGTGEPNNPYLIYTAEQMNAIGADRKDWDKHFKLMADIDLGVYSGGDFKIIGTAKTNPFRGVFDGNRKRISRFTTTKRDYTGLFGYVMDSSAEIKNLGLINPNIQAGEGSYVASLVGYLDAGIVTNCYVEGGRVSGKKYVGGLVGYNQDGQINSCHATCRVSGDEEAGGLAGYHRGAIDNCYTAGNVSGNKQIGGLVGRNYSGTITNSMATGAVSAQEYPAGGLAGSSSGIISNCSATGNISGKRSVGGLVGQNGGTLTGSYSSGLVSGDSNIGGLAGSNTGIISNCYAAGDATGNGRVGGLAGVNTWPGKISDCYSVGGVTGTTDVGGLVGFNDEGSVRTSFWDVRTSGRNNMCGREVYGTGCDNANGRTTAEMQRQETFLHAGWDFVAETTNGTENIWSICEGSNYPQFVWQFRTGDFDGDAQVDSGDFAILADRWLDIDSSFFWCRGADLTQDGKVDYHDLKEFAENWLAGGPGALSKNSYVIIDDFESYNDLDPGDPASNRIFDAWLDGYANRATNGAVVGYENPPYAERNIVHGGTQSMPYFYDTLFKFSKAELPLDPPLNWTEEGAEILSLWFYGDRSNAPAPMSIVLNGSSTVYHDNPEAVRLDTWTQWTIELQAFAGADLGNISSIAICFGDKNNIQAGGSGKMLFDDIQLYRSR